VQCRRYAARSGGRLNLRTFFEPLLRTGGTPLIVIINGSLAEPDHR
jgi:hypothetical protein